MSFNDERAGWKVHFNKFLKHVVHDLNKGITDQVYSYNGVDIKTGGSTTTVLVEQKEQGFSQYFSVRYLGTEQLDFKDNLIEKHLTLSSNTATMSQVNNTNSQETKKMKESTVSKAVSNATSTLKTVGQQLQDTALTAAKMEAGENILLALRNVVMEKAGFMQKVKFKFAPIALDIAVTLGADVLVTELMPNKRSAKLAVECLNLAMTKEVIHTLPLTEFTNALTGGSALGKVKDLLTATNND